MQTSANQNLLPLSFGMHKAPTDAPAKVVRQVESEAQALAISITAGGHKLAYVAACIGKSIPYVSQMKTGARPIPRRLISPLCAATGTNLLAQVVALLDVMDGVDDVQRLAEQMAIHIESKRKAA